MKQILGSNPISSVAGYLLAGLYAAKEMMAAGPVKWYDVAIPVAIAILGRVAADSTNAKPKS